MFEAGWGLGTYRYDNDARPEVKFERGTPEWYANAPHSDTVLAKTWKSASWLRSLPLRNAYMSSLSYVTGSHSFKFGVDQQWGEWETTADQNADLTQIYLNGVPSFVDVAPTPSRVKSELKAERRPAGAAATVAFLTTAAITGSAAWNARREGASATITKVCVSVPTRIGVR